MALDRVASSVTLAVAVVGLVLPNGAQSAPAACRRPLWPICLCPKNYFPWELRQTPSKIPPVATSFHRQAKKHHHSKYRSTSARFFRTRGINRGLARSSSRKPNWFCRKEVVSCRRRNGQLNGNVEAQLC
jgi:hypothetical protein